MGVTMDSRRRRHGRKDQPVVQVGKLFDRSPPHSQEAEMAALGCLVLDPSLVPQARVLVPPEAFYLERHAILWQAILDTWDQHGALDLTLVCARMDASGHDGDKAVDYLVDLAEQVPTATNLAHYAAVVADKARLRRAVEDMGAIMHRVYTTPVEADTVVQAMAESAASLANVDGLVESVTLTTAEVDVLECIDHRRRDVVATGVPVLDRLQGGLPRQGVVVVYGYPSSGKTTLTLTMAVGLAKGGLPVRVFSNEQGARRVAATIMSSSAGVPVHRHLNMGTQPGVEERLELDKVVADHAGLDLRLVERSLAAPQIANEVRLAHARGGPGVAIVDYLQDLPGWDSFQDSTPRIGESMRVLAQVARDLGWLVVVVSQLDKSAAKENRAPRLADGLGSSVIEQRSDFTMYVWRPHQGERPEQTGDEVVDRANRRRYVNRQRRVEVGIIKNKYGPLGTRQAAMDLSCLSFRDPTDDELHDWADR